MTLSVVARDSSGIIIRNPTISWRALQPAVAVGALGMVTAVTDGVAQVVASSGEAADTATVTVHQIAATLALDPARDTGFVGDSAPFTASARDGGGERRRRGIDLGARRPRRASSTRWL